MEVSPEDVGIVEAALEDVDDAPVPKDRRGVDCEVRRQCLNHKTRVTDNSSRSVDGNKKTEGGRRKCREQRENCEPETPEPPAALES